MNENLNIYPIKPLASKILGFMKYLSIFYLSIRFKIVQIRCNSALIKGNTLLQIQIIEDNSIHKNQ